jgi:hypothetical protein
MLFVVTLDLARHQARHLGTFQGLKPLPEFCSLFYQGRDCPALSFRNVRRPIIAIDLDTGRIHFVLVIQLLLRARPTC